MTVESVRTFETAGGNTRYVVRDTDGREFTTFRERIGEPAKGLEGRQVRIEYHEEKRDRFTNVYLDKIEPLPGDGGEDTQDSEAADAAEAAWRTAVDAAPWLVGESEPHTETPPDELFEKLKPFEERVAEDIRKESDKGTED